MSRTVRKQLFEILHTLQTANGMLEGLLGGVADEAMARWCVGAEFEVPCFEVAYDVAVGVGFGLQDLAQSAGCVGVPLDRQDVPCLTVGVDEGGVLGLAVVAYFLFLWCLICLGISLSYFIPCL